MDDEKKGSSPYKNRERPIVLRYKMEPAAGFKPRLGQERKPAAGSNKTSQVFEAYEVSKTIPEASDFLDDFY